MQRAASAALGAGDNLAGAAAAAETLPADAAARLMDSAGDAFTQGLGTVATLGTVVVAGLAVAAASLLRHERAPAEPAHAAGGS